MNGIKYKLENNIFELSISNDSINIVELYEEFFSLIGSELLELTDKRFKIKVDENKISNVIFSYVFQE